jgi:hypothetical protein
VYLIVSGYHRERRGRLQQSWANFWEGEGGLFVFQLEGRLLPLCPKQVANPPLRCFVSYVSSGGLFGDLIVSKYIKLPLIAASIVISILLLPIRRVKSSVRSKLRRLDWYGSVLTLA